MPFSFLDGMLSGARKLLPPDQVIALGQHCGIAADLFANPNARVTQEQFVKMYEAVSLTTGDEMLGLWSRPIRSGALKYLALSLQDASSLLVAMYRFTRFWNLLLDDYQLQLSRQADAVTISLNPLNPAHIATPFGHELMVKLTHGVASWLGARQLPILRMGFGFDRPDKFHEYAHLFPGPVTFNEPATSISFEEAVLRQPFHRTRQEIVGFVRRAPDDWIFVTFDHGSTAQQVRHFLVKRPALSGNLEAAARHLNQSTRSLSRRLMAEGTSFRDLKEELRRDMAIEHLVKGRDSIDQIAAAVGFENTPAFHRAFRAWTGSTPRRYTQS